jgi:hypothetical protein
MNMKTNDPIRCILLSLLPLALASGCVLDKQSLGDPEGDTEGEDASASDSIGSTGGESATTSAGPGSAATTDTTHGTDDGACGPNICGPCLPGCTNVDTCVDGEWDCSCACDTDDTDGTETGPAVCPEDPLGVPSQLAYRHADLPSSGGGDDGGGSGGSSTTVTDGDGPDPDTLVVRLGTEPLACGESPTYACDTWRVTISIPPQYQEPGVYDIDDTEITVGYSMQGPPHGNDPDDCSFGGGGGFGGTLEIFAIDDDTVHGAFCSTDLFDVDADGVFTATRC